MNRSTPLPTGFYSAAYTWTTADHRFGFAKAFASVPSLMLSVLLLMMLVLAVSVGNFALGYALALYFGHGPADGWGALISWKQNTPVTPSEPPAPETEPPAAPTASE